MRKRLAATLAAAALVGFMSATGAALAGPPLNAGPHEHAGGLHLHYIVPGPNDCMILKAPAMAFDGRGLHHGANKSSGATPSEGEFGLLDARGPWHQLGEPGADCDSHHNEH